MISHQYRYGLGLLLLALTSTVYALLDIEVNQATDAALPITIMPFVVPASLQSTDELETVIRRDLARSGEFMVKASPAHLRDQRSPTPTERLLSQLKQLGVETAVFGRIDAHEQGGYTVNIYLVDVYQHDLSSTNTLIAKRFHVASSADFRRLAHHISDLIYERLTGFRGAFSSHIAYVSTQWSQGRLHRYVLTIADADGYNPQPLLTSSEPIMSPAWSPDGQRIAYVSFEHQRAEIYISTVATGERVRVSAYPGINGAPSWSPDGKHLALVLSHENVPKIFQLNVATGQLKQLTHGWSIDTEPRWLPDGRSILFTSNRGGKPQIYRISLDSGTINRITFTGNYNARASVSPDGKRMVLIHKNKNGDYQIAVQDLVTNQLSVLTNTRLDESPSLSPNGRMVMYGTLHAGKRVLSAVSIDGRVKLSLPSSDGEVQEPAWSPHLS